MSIKVLAPQVINQIAAGEIIERPASIVRELLDNAFDAGASEILIELELGGLSRIAVIDNGSGIRSLELPLAFERHATSKLERFEDLLSIQSMGFRGEALPSIAAVARVCVHTRSQEEELGSRMRIEAGECVEHVPQACPLGTSIEVRDLFFNLPARKKFLKSAAAEEQRIKTLVKHMAVVRPHIRLRLQSAERELLNLPAKKSMQDRAAGIFKGASLAFEHSAGPISVCGLLTPPAAALSDGSGLVIFVNQRLVQDRMLVRAIKDGFGFVLKAKEYPAGFVSVDLAAEFVDINVHPQKSEVRFRAPQAVFVEVSRAVKNSLAEFKSPIFIERPQPSGSNADASIYSIAGQTKLEQQGLWSAGEARNEYGAGSVEPDASAEFRFSNLRFLEVALGCYLLCEYNQQLFIIDMHAAHERYNFNLIRNGFRNRNLPSQKLLIPISVQVGEEAQSENLKFQDLWERMGFEVEAFGEDALLVRAVPALLGSADTEALVREMAQAEFSEMAAERFETQIDSIAARLACHASIRSGDMLSASEVYALFTDLDRSEFSQACPHGRPVLVSFSRAEVERWFGRDR